MKTNKKKSLVKNDTRGSDQLRQIKPQKRCCRGYNVRLAGAQTWNIWQLGDIVRVDMGFSEGSKMRWACREGGQEQDPAVLLRKRKRSGDTSNRIKEEIRKRKEKQMILKLRKDKYVLSAVKTSTEIKKKIIVFNSELSVYGQMFPCQPESLSKWAEWGESKHYFYLSKSSRH